MKPKNNQISYIEFQAVDLKAIKEFYTSCLGWTFTDYGPTYIAFSDSGVKGGFELSDSKPTNGVLVVLYHSDLNAIKTDITKAGGKITKDIFDFPGGQRFHFSDPSGNELAIWSEAE